ncbi:DUF262 domain-containing protein [Pseudomonas chengduensis]|nr:DUF262 domain-containing protein [Pseudomonas chengduensis]MDH0959370.1 DUF262 domain-containing protein [Pseudomonas chengduensis]
MSEVQVEIELEDSENLESGVEDQAEEAPYEAVSERKVLIQQYDYAVRTLMDMIIEGDLKLDPDYQRNYRWDEKKASRFIESIALNIPVPVFYFAEEQDGTFSVIDGQQRLTSLIRYLKAAEVESLFPDQDIKPLVLEGLKVRDDLNGTQYTSLSRTDRSVLGKRPVRCIVVLNESDSTLKFEVFERLNSGSVQLSDQEIRNCIYRGGLNKLIKELSVNSRFRELAKLPAASQKNMKYTELVLRFLAYRELSNDTKYANNYTEYLNQFMEDNREVSAARYEKIRSLFNATVDILYEHLGAGVAFRKPNDLSSPLEGGFALNLINGSIYESQMISVSRLVESGKPIPGDLKGRMLGAFSNQQYADTIFQGTSQKSKAIRRSQLLTEAIIN